MGCSVLASGELGKHNGLPCTIIVSTTLQDLQSAAGVAVTAGGSLLPMREVIRLAAPSASPPPGNASFCMRKTVSMTY